MFGIYVYWCSLLLLIDLQTWNIRRNPVCVGYFVVFEHLHIHFKVTLVKTKTFEVTSKTCAEFIMKNPLCLTLFSVRYKQSSAKVGFVWFSG